MFTNIPSWNLVSNYVTEKEEEQLKVWGVQKSFLSRFFGNKINSLVVMHSLMIKKENDCQLPSLDLSITTILGNFLTLFNPPCKGNTVCFVNSHFKCYTLFCKVLYNNS